MSCRGFVPLLEPFVDGELQPEKVVEVEQHLEECSRCVERVRLGRAVRISLRRAVRPSSEPSAAFRARLVSAMAATQERERMLEQQIERTRMLSWRTILPVAAAAALTLVWAASANKVSPSSQYHYAQNASVDELLEEIIDHHVKGRPEVTSLSLLPSLEREVGVPVQPPILAQYGARWEGASVVPMHNQRAASLRYKVAGHPVTLYVFDSSRFQIENHLQRRLVGDAPVYVGARRGYSIGATEHRGVGYAMATDLNDAETAELIAALH
ncbi:MAG: anti-sigma factor family protein [Myxococcota bacterium]